MSVILSCWKSPQVWYSVSSERAFKIAGQISSMLVNERDLITKTANDDPCILLILDWKDDPVTPLLNQWNYQAMIHELIGISNHRVKLASVKDEIVLSPD